VSGPPLTAGVDVGGTKVLAGAVDAHGVVRDVVRLGTPHRSTDPRLVEDTIAAAVQTLQARVSAGAGGGRARAADGGGRIGAAGVGAAGFVDADGARVRFAPHLSWRDEPLRDHLRDRLGVPVLLDNDANATAWAEHAFGAAQGRRHVVCLTLGTGIGGALILDGRLFHGANGMAGEFGHQQVVPDGRRCECGNRGCWEQYASGNALVREARRLLQGSTEAGRLRQLTDGDPDRLTGPLVTRAAVEGDRSAVGLLHEVGSWLGTGLAGLTAGLDPELVVVGGGVSVAGELLLGPAREALAATLVGRGFRPVPAVVPAQLGESAGMLGAAHLARSLL
jgi:glucokinase